MTATDRKDTPASAPLAPPLVLAIATLVLVILGALTWHRGHAYLNEETLWRDTLRKNPNALIANNNLGALLLLRGELAEATSFFEASLRLNPNDPDALDNLGLVRERQGRTDEAEALYRRALQCDATCVDAHNNLGIILARRGQTQEAAGHFREAVRLQPSFAKAQVNLGLVLQSQGQTREAVGAYREALRYMGNAPELARRLAWILATDPDDGARDGAEAVRLAEAASTASGDADPLTLDILAAAYAEIGRYDDAVRAEERALKIAASAPNASAGALEAANARLALYRSGRPFRSRTP